jgi:AcrR family transcriptional regulator
MRRLMNAGCALFTEFGYEATTIDQIASQAGVSRAAFYLHFETKADIIHALIANVGESLREHYAALAALGPAPSLEAVAAWTHDFFETCRSDGSTVLLLHRTLQPNGELFDEIAFYDDIMGLLGTGFPRFAAAASDRETHAEALLFFLELQALIRLLCTSDSRLDWESICRASAKSFLAFTRAGRSE